MHVLNGCERPNGPKAIKLIIPRYTAAYFIEGRLTVQQAAESGQTTMLFSSKDVIVKRFVFIPDN